MVLESYPATKSGLCEVPFNVPVNLGVAAPLDAIAAIAEAREERASAQGAALLPEVRRQAEPQPDRDDRCEERSGDETQNVEHGVHPTNLADRDDDDLEHRRC